MNARGRTPPPNPLDGSGRGWGECAPEGRRREEEGRALRGRSKGPARLTVGCGTRRGARGAARPPLWLCAAVCVSLASRVGGDGECPLDQWNEGPGEECQACMPLLELAQGRSKCELLSARSYAEATCDLAQEECQGSSSRYKFVSFSECPADTAPRLSASATPRYRIGVSRCDCWEGSEAAGCVQDLAWIPSVGPTPATPEPASLPGADPRT